MRLSELVAQRGLDPFNFDDFLFVGSKLSSAPDRLILVGGQAIETWGIYFDVPRPAGVHQALTEDTDFYGSPKDAQWLCSLLGKKSTELIINKNWDSSPNTAQAYIQRPDGRVLLMDFLRAVVGLTHDEIVKLAVPVRISGVRLNILHPLYCMESRLANLDKLPSKRNTNGVLQAHWAIDIVEAYLWRMREQGASNREMIKACAQVAEAAEYRSGPYCFHAHGVDVLKAVSDRVLDTVGGRFVVDDWPRRLERIHRKRAQKLFSYRVSLTEKPTTPKLPYRLPSVPAQISESLPSASAADRGSS